MILTNIDSIISNLNTVNFALLNGLFNEITMAHYYPNCFLLSLVKVGTNQIKLLNRTKLLFSLIMFLKLKLFGLVCCVENMLVAVFFAV